MFCLICDSFGFLDVDGGMFAAIELPKIFLRDALSPVSIVPALVESAVCYKAALLACVSIVEPDAVVFKFLTATF